MNIQLQGSDLFWGGGIFGNNGLKSTQEKQHRQAERDSQIAFFEKQKSNLKNMKCDSLDEIGRKLEMFHSYEDRIAAVKEEYNSSQMMHVFDEARERGEQIAKAAEEYAPKMPEERKEEALEEALGTDDSNGILTEIMEELSEQMPEMVTEELPGELSEQLEGELPGELSEETADMEMPEQSVWQAESLSASLKSAAATEEQLLNAKHRSVEQVLN